MSCEPTVLLLATDESNGRIDEAPEIVSVPGVASVPPMMAALKSSVPAET
jgi:hypothetical protein